MPPPEVPVQRAWAEAVWDKATLSRVAATMPSAARQGGSVTVDHLAETEGGVEDRALFLPPAARARGGLVDAIGEPAERQRLQPHAAGAGERREEDPLAAEERGLDLAYELDVVVHRRLERDQA